MKPFNTDNSPEWICGYCGCINKEFFRCAHCGAEKLAHLAENFRRCGRLFMDNVESSCIDKIGYDHLSQRLVVSMTTGGEYEYIDVPSYIYEDFLKAESKGRFFIKNPASQ